MWLLISVAATAVLGRSGSCSVMARDISSAAAALQAIGLLPGQELVEKHAQRVDVAGSRDLLALDLLRAGVVRRHRAQAGRGLA